MNDFNNLMREMFGNDLSIVVALAAQFGNQIDQKALYDFTTNMEVYTVPNEAIQYFLDEVLNKIQLSGQFIQSACFKNITESKGAFVIENSALNKDFIFLYHKNSTSLTIQPFEMINNKWVIASMPIKVINAHNELVIKLLDTFQTTPNGYGNTHNIIKTSQSEVVSHVYLLLFCFISNQCYAATS
jgi:hypothetical protein